MTTNPNTQEESNETDAWLERRNTNVVDVLGANGYFSQKIPNFIVRNGQLEMSINWQDSIRDNSLLVCEAGTGTGKTFAYLVPALLSGKTLVISTASKALQDQLIKKDIPAVFDLLGIPPDYMALKGFNNYLCLKNYHEVSSKYVSTHSLDFGEVKKSDKSTEDEPLKNDEDLLDEAPVAEIITKEVLAKVEALIAQTNRAIELNLPNIDFVEVNSKFSSDVSKQITCSTEWCNKKKCPYRDECYPYLARDRVVKTKVVVVNHSLFFSDMEIDDVFDPLSPSILLPKYRVVIFDEAHELPAVGREHLSKSLGTADVRKFKKDLDYIRKSKQIPFSVFEDQYKILARAFGSLFEYLKTAEGGGENKRNIQFYKYIDYDETNRDPFYLYTHKNEDFLSLMRNLYVEHRNFKKFIEDNLDLDTDFFNKVIAYTNYKIETIVDLMKLDDKDDPRNLCYGKYVGTVEVGRKSFNLSLTPLEISDTFGNYLSKCEVSNLSVLMTSATLAVSHKFNKFLRDIGAPDNTKAIEVESSFNYTLQSAIYTDTIFPRLEDSDRIDKIVDMLLDTIEHTPGGIFFLTTSYNALNKANYLLYKAFNGKRKIYCQNGIYSNSEMLQKFKEDGNAILIGTSSFWAGVDVPGKALSLVIIDKIPFESPSDPIFKARCDYFDAKHEKKMGSFFAISIPEAVIELRQGVGRLIRHEDDIGGLIICDPRLKAMGYGSIFLRSLPNMTRCESLDEIPEFLQRKVQIS